MASPGKKSSLPAAPSDSSTKAEPLWMRRFVKASSEPYTEPVDMSSSRGEDVMEFYRNLLTVNAGSQQELSSGSATEETFRCTDCDKNFPTNDVLQQHERSIGHLVMVGGKSEAEAHVYALNEGNPGYTMLRNAGWTVERGLGAERQGRKQPVGTRLKIDKVGLGYPHRQQRSGSIVKADGGRKRVTHSAKDIREAAATGSSSSSTSGARKAREDAERDRKHRQAMLAYMNRNTSLQ